MRPLLRGIVLEIWITLALSVGQDPFGQPLGIPPKYAAGAAHRGTGRRLVLFDPLDT